MSKASLPFQSRRGQRGSTLVIVLAFVLVSSMIAGTAITAASSYAKLSDRQVKLERAMFITETGLEQAVQLIKDNRGYLGDVTVQRRAYGGGRYEYVITKTGWRRYRISVKGSYKEASRGIGVRRAFFPTYAKYALWMRVNGRIYFIPGEVFDGHVHSDDRLYFSSSRAYGGPEFFEPVTSLSTTYGGTTDWVTFHKGFDLGTPQGSMASVDFDLLEGLSANPVLNGLLLEGKTTIRLEGDIMRITNQRKGWNRQPVPIRPEQLVYVKDASRGRRSGRAGQVHIYGGTLDGAMSIVAEDDILIYDHIRYRNDPRDDASDLAERDFPEPSDDALGLISKDDIWVATAAPDNLEVFAAMMATGQKPNNDGSFGVLRYNAGSPRGFLNVYGGIVQDVRGAVGIFGSRGIIHGYAKNYSFDKRFEDVAPPFYPTIDSSIKLEGWTDGPSS